MAANDEIPLENRVLLTIADEARRADLRDAIERRGSRDLSVATTGDALVIGFAERCDAVVVCVEPEGLVMAQAVGLLEWLGQRRGRPVRSVALVPGEDRPDLTVALAAGFDLVFGRLATPDQIAEAVVRLAARPGAGPSPRAAD